MSGFISLLTDFGRRDGNVGVMKGVIWGIAPEAKIADLSHSVAPQNILEAAFVLERTAYYFPENTVHVVVVDPGVGTERRPIAAQIGPQRFVGPDNGVVTPMLVRAEKEGWPITIVHLDKPKYWLPEVSHVFHGRDIFAPCGAHLSVGVPLEKLGTAIDDPIELPFPRPKRSKDGWLGEVLHVDHFGNVYTNVQQADLNGNLEVDVSLNGATIKGMVQAFGERPPGELVALYSSTGYLLVSEVNGSAAQRLKSKVGDPVAVSLRAS